MSLLADSSAMDSIGFLIVMKSGDKHIPVVKRYNRWWYLDDELCHPLLIPDRIFHWSISPLLKFDSFVDIYCLSKTSSLPHQGIKLLHMH